MNDSLNNYCRNCGKKLKKGDTVCKECDTKVLYERVKNDNKYITLTIISIVCFLFGFIIPLTSIIAVIILIYAKSAYPDKDIIKIILAIELLILSAIIILIFMGAATCFEWFGGYL